MQIWVKDCKDLPPARGVIIDPFVKWCGFYISYLLDSQDLFYILRNVVSISVPALTVFIGFLIYFIYHFNPKATNSESRSVSLRRYG